MPITLTKFICPKHSSPVDAYAAYILAPDQGTCEELLRCDDCQLSRAVRVDFPSLPINTCNGPMDLGVWEEATNG